MSCTSPFTFTAVGTSQVNWESATTYSGTAKIPGYTWKSCVSVPDLTYATCTLGMECCCTSFKTFSHKYKTCWCPCCNTQTYSAGTCFSVTLWPELTFVASAGSTYAFVTEESLKFSLTPTGTDPAIATTQSIEITSIFVTLNVNGVAIAVNVPSSLTVETEETSSGEVEFMATISFPSDSETSGSYAGVNYSINPYFLMCATPENGVGYLNIVLPCSLSYDAGSYSTSWQGETWDFNLGTYNCNVSVTCPIIAAE